MGGSACSGTVRHADMPTLWPRALHSRFAVCARLHAGELSRGAGLRGFESGLKTRSANVPLPAPSRVLDFSIRGRMLGIWGWGRTMFSGPQLTRVTYGYVPVNRG